MSRLIGCARCLTSLARVTTASACGAAHPMLNGFDCVVVSVSCSHKVAVLRATEAAIWIALSTCCRVGELLSARWEHIDFERKTWLIPAEHSKNGKTHTVSLSELALAQFKRVCAINSALAWCYPNVTNNGAVSSKTVTKQLGDRQRLTEDSIIAGRSANSKALLLPGGK